MAGKRNPFFTPFKVGLLVASSFVAFVVFLQIVSTRGFGTQEVYEVSALFDDVLGLEPASPVQIAGIDVGRITKVELDGGKARVFLEIQQNIELYEDAKIEKVAVSLLGDYKLAVEPGSASLPRIKPGGEITNVRSMSDIDAITGEVRQISEALRELIAGKEGQPSALEQIVMDVKGTVAAAKDISERVRDDIDRDMTRVEHILQNVDRFTADLRKISKGKDQDFDKIVADTRAIAESIRRTSETIEKMVAGQEGEGSETMASLQTSVDNLNDSLANISSITGKVDEGQGTVGKLVNDEQLHDDIAEAAEGINSLVGGISRLQTWVNLRSEFQIQSAAAKSYVQVAIMPWEDKGYILELVNDPRGSREVIIEDVETTSPETGQTYRYRERRVRTTEGFTFSAMFAKRLYFAQLRFGIIESYGGIGADFFFLDDRLRFLVDVNRFGEDDRLPRVKGLAEMQLIPYIYAHAGVDDFLNESTFDYFVGLGVRFNDEDLKTLLALVGGAVSGGGN